MMKKFLMTCCLLLMMFSYVNHVSAQSDRIAGKTRYETAVEVSKAGWETSKTVILATGMDFPDALTGAPLSGKYYAPILLTTPNKLHDTTKQEIVRLKAKQVIILGGEAAVSKNVEADLKKIGVTVFKRYGGENRFETAIKIATDFTDSNIAILANGYSFPDALSIAPFAGRNLAPILLTDKAKMSPTVAEILHHRRNVFIIGGQSSVSDAIKNKIDAKRFNDYPISERISGSDRYATNAAVINRFKFGYDDKRTAYLAKGSDFADALTGSALAIKKGGTIVLTKSNSLPDPINDIFKQKFYAHVYTLGGQAAIDENVRNQVYKLSDNSEYTKAKKIELDEWYSFSEIETKKRFFKFEVTQESGILMGGTGNISFINRILDENLNPILTHNMDTVMTKGFPLVPLRKGTYTLEIDGDSNGKLEYFGLYFSLIENRETEKETNNTQNTATPLTINNDMYSTMGADTIDYYSFKWDKKGNARLTLKYHPYISYTYTLIDENGIEKATFEAPTIDGYEPNYTDVRYAIHQKVLDVELEQGQYFIKVEAQQLDPQLYAVSVSTSIQE